MSTYKTKSVDESWMDKRPSGISADVWELVGNGPMPETATEVAMLMQKCVDVERKRMENLLTRGRNNAADKVRHAQNDEVMFEAKRTDATQRRNAYSDSIDVFDTALNALKSGKATP